VIGSLFKAKGGSSTAATQATLPDWLEAPLKTLITDAQAAYSTPYEAYTGERVAGFNEDQQNYFDMIRNSIAGQPMDFSQPKSIMNEAARRGLEGYSQAELQPFMNPYIKNVLDISRRQQLEDYTQQRNEFDARAAEAGAFGGSRFGLQSAQMSSDIQRQLADTYQQGLASAYESGMGRAVEGTQQAQGAGLNLANLMLNEQQGRVQQAQTLGTAGQVQQGQTQAELDQAYNDFVERKMYPYQQQQYLSSLLIPTAQLMRGQTTTQTQKAGSGSPFGQALGLASTIAGFKFADGGAPRRRLSPLDLILQSVPQFGGIDSVQAPQMEAPPEAPKEDWGQSLGNLIDVFKGNKGTTPEGGVKGAPKDLKITNSNTPSAIRIPTKEELNKRLAQPDNQDSVLDLLTRTMLGEARGEGADGMQAVANVILNRTQGNIDRIPEVIKAPKQFSIFNNMDDPNTKEVMNLPASDEAYQKARNIALEVLEGQRGDITGGATHYVNPETADEASLSWRRKMIQGPMIGRHQFYNMPEKYAQTFADGGSAITEPFRATQGMSPIERAWLTFTNVASAPARGLIGLGQGVGNALSGLNEGTFTPDETSIAPGIENQARTPLERARLYEAQQKYIDSIQPQNQGLAAPAVVAAPLTQPTTAQIQEDPLTTFQKAYAEEVTPAPTVKEAEPAERGMNIPLMLFGASLLSSTKDFLPALGEAVTQGVSTKSELDSQRGASAQKDFENQIDLMKAITYQKQTENTLKNADLNRAKTIAEINQIQGKGTASPLSDVALDAVKAKIEMMVAQGTPLEEQRKFLLDAAKAFNIPPGDLGTLLTEGTLTEQDVTEEELNLLRNKGQ
jgi:spore germination cell wall hydrolase CwlJ-like protein